MLAAMVERAAPDVRAHHVFGNSDPEGFAASAAEVGGALAGAHPGGRGRRRRRPLPGGREPAGTCPGAQAPSLSRYRRLCGTSTCWMASKSSTPLPAPATTAPHRPAALV